MNFQFGLIPLQAQPEGSPFGAFVPIILITGIFYFLLIRPQQKKQKKLEAMIKAIEKGDNVVTSGGLHGKVIGVTDDVLTLDIGGVKGERVKVKVTRARIEHVDVASKRGEESCVFAGVQSGSSRRFCSSVITRSRISPRKRPESRARGCPTTRCASDWTCAAASIG